MEIGRQSALMKKSPLNTHWCQQIGGTKVCKLDPGLQLDNLQSSTEPAMQLAAEEVAIEQRAGKY
jgi:hypothetical protein